MRERTHPSFVTAYRSFLIQLALTQVVSWGAVAVLQLYSQPLFQLAWKVGAGVLIAEVIFYAFIAWDYTREHRRYHETLDALPKTRLAIHAEHLINELEYELRHQDTAVYQ
jgi:hypothetical protein